MTPKFGIKSERFFVKSQAVIIDEITNIRKKLDKEPGMNPLRAMNELYITIYNRFASEKIPQNMHLLFNYTIGNVDPRTWGRLKNGDIDPWEKEYKDLATEMGINPFSLEHDRLLMKLLSYERDFWLNQDHYSITGYDPRARGTVETRQTYIDYLEQYGFKNLNVDQTFLCAGGMDGIVRSVRALTCLRRQQKGDVQAGLTELIVQTMHQLVKETGKYTGKELNLLVKKAQKVFGDKVSQKFKSSWLIKLGFLLPGFKMAATAAESEGPVIEFIKTFEEEMFVLPYNRVSEILKQNPQMEMMMIIPFNNPTGTAWNGDELRNTLGEIKRLRPDMIFIFDMAYLGSVSQEIAKSIVGSIYESQVFENSVFIMSRSKEYGQPALRSGMILTPNLEFIDAIQKDTLRSYATFPYLVDLFDRALTEYYRENPEIRQKYLELHRLRQCILRDTLKELNEQYGLFDKNYLTRLKIAGEKTEKGDIVMESPLYLYLRLNPGITAWDLASLGIIAAPSEVFDSLNERKYVRFSVGTMSSSEIKNMLTLLKRAKPYLIKPQAI